MQNERDIGQLALEGATGLCVLGGLTEEFWKFTSVCCLLRHDTGGNDKKCKTTVFKKMKLQHLLENIFR